MNGLRGLDQADSRAIGTDLLRAQWRWRLACHDAARWEKVSGEVRTDLPSKRAARVLACFYQGCVVALHGFIKKARATSVDDLTLARKRQKELEQ